MRTRTFISSAGVRLTGDVGGNPAATSVVLLHGGVQTRHSWGRAARELIAHGYHAASIDLRGHGDSEWAADGDYGLDNQAADIRAVISELPTAPVLIGASMGGLVALTVTGESAPQLVKGLILVDVTPRVDDDGREKIRDFMRARGDGFASIDEAADAISRYQPNRPRPSDLSGLSRNLRLRGDGRWYWHWDPKFLETFETDPVLSGLRYEAAARNVSVPAMLVRGAKSELVKPEHVRHFQQLIPHAEYADVSGAAHMIAGDKNDAFNGVVLEFLQRNAAAGPPSRPATSSGSN